MVLYARSVVFIELTINNPTTALLRDDASNVWNLQVTQRTYAKLMEETVLSGTGDYWGSVSVLGILTQGYIQPS
eukprot:3485210-Amphidinium_carterae.1